jgi:hypothetical protein
VDITALVVHESIRLPFADNANGRANDWDGLAKIPIDLAPTDTRPNVQGGVVAIKIGRHT